MRRFSQRNSLVTLSDINITPLLDLAFVLLIIFVIISPSIKNERENSLQLTLPKGGSASERLDPKDVRRIELVPGGGWRFEGKAMSVEQIQTTMKAQARSNPNLLAYVRAGGDEQIKRVTPLMTFFGNEGIKFSLATEP